MKDEINMKIRILKKLRLVDQSITIWVNVPNPIIPHTVPSKRIQKSIPHVIMDVLRDWLDWLKYMKRELVRYGKSKF